MDPSNVASVLSLHLLVDSASCRVILAGSDSVDEAGLLDADVKVEVSAISRDGSISFGHSRHAELAGNPEDTGEVASLHHMVGGFLLLLCNLNLSQK